MSPALGEGSLNHWTTNEVPSSKLFLNFIYFFWLCWVFIASNRIFSSCGKWELLSSCDAWTSHCGGLSFADLGLWGVEASVTAACGLNDVVHRLSCSAACGVFLGQGLNLCPLPWQAEFFTTAPPGKSKLGSNLNKICFVITDPRPKSQSHLWAPQ